jgi:CBS-domain-containing membrane protein
MVLRARDVMTSRVVSVRQDTTLERARYLLTENRFSALPVVDDRHRLIGIVSTFDLLRAEASPRDPGTVGEVMTHRLREYGEMRVMPITEGGRGGMLVGIVTRGDLLTPEPSGGPVGRFFQRRGRGGRAGTPLPGAADVRTGSTVADIMTPDEQVYDLTEDMPVTTAAALLREYRITAMPILNDDRHVLGILSEADLVPDTLSGRRTAPPSTVGGAMTEDVICVRDTCSVSDLAHSMASNRLRTLPVVDHHGRMVGIVSRGDVLRATAPVGEGR